MVAQFRHTEDARLHEAPARQTESIMNTFISHLISTVKTALMVAGDNYYKTALKLTNLSFSDSSRFLTVERERTSITLRNITYHNVHQYYILILTECTV